MPSAACGPHPLDEELTIIDPFRDIATHEFMVAQSRAAEHLPAVIADRFRPRPAFFLVVRGDSMDRTGLHDSELVAIRAEAEPCEGKVIVARLDNEVTLKHYRRVDEETVELRPESHNEEHAPQRVDLAKDELHIDGSVVGALIGGVFECTAAPDSAA